MGKGTQKKWYIKTRMNPQLGTYYSPMGQLTKTEANELGKAVYGCNIMTPYNTKEDYDKAIASLKADGRSII